MTQKTNELITKIKKERPLILNINQYFSLDLIVSGLRSIGALPITSNAVKEIDELLKLSKAVVINLGKLDDEFIQLCDRICQSANELKIPIILDPVGVGASCYRTETSINLIKNHKISVVCAYPGEIAALLYSKLIKIGTKSTVDELVSENAKLLSEKYDLAIVLSGKKHTVIDANKIDHINFDSAIVQKVAGISSLLSSIIGAFHAVEENRFIAATTAIAYYGCCVAIANNKAAGPGSFKSGLIDELYLKSYIPI